MPVYPDIERGGQVKQVVELARHPQVGDHLALHLTPVSAQVGDLPRRIYRQMRCRGTPAPDGGIYALAADRVDEPCGVADQEHVAVGQGGAALPQGQVVSLQAPDI